MPPKGLNIAMNIPRIRWLAVALLSAVWSLSSTAQEEPQAPETEEETEEESETQPQPPPSSENSGADDVFIPSEEISADEEVTFPVDI
jgi:hypothetical protein